MLHASYNDGCDRLKGHTHRGLQNRQEYLKRLAETGINLQEMMATGQLEVPRTDMYVRHHHFD